MAHLETLLTAEGRGEDQSPETLADLNQADVVVDFVVDNQDTNLVLGEREVHFGPTLEDLGNSEFLEVSDIVVVIDERDGLREIGAADFLDYLVVYHPLGVELAAFVLVELDSCVLGQAWELLCGVLRLMFILDLSGDEPFLLLEFFEVLREVEVGEERLVGIFA